MNRKMHPYTTHRSSWILLIQGLAILAGVTTTNVASALEEGNCDSLKPKEHMAYGTSARCELSPEGDTDTFRFFGNKGDRISVVVGRIGPLRQATVQTPCVAIFDPKGATLFELQCSADQVIEIDLEKSGTHRVRVTEELNNDLTDYGISLACLGGHCGPAILSRLPDTDGDGRAELIVRRGNLFLMDLAGNGGKHERKRVYGEPGDQVFAADMDGDGRDELVIRKGRKYLIDTANNGGQPEDSIKYGRSKDVVFAADMDGDGRDDLVLRRGNRFLVDTAHDGDRPELVLKYKNADDKILTNSGTE